MERLFFKHDRVRVKDPMGWFSEWREDLAHLVVVKKRAPKIGDTDIMYDVRNKDLYYTVAQSELERR